MKPSSRVAIESAKVELSMGSGVIDDLVAGIADWKSSTQAGQGTRIALGCVPWLTSMRVVDELVEGFDLLTIVTRKSPEGRLSPACERLLREGRMGHTAFIPGLEGWSTGDAVQNWADPEDVDEASYLDAVRVFGYRDEQRATPMVHAKCLVLGFVPWDGCGFVAERVWMGSANWTDMADNFHAETGLWIHESRAAFAAAQWLGHIIRESEPPRSTKAMPTPDLEEAPFDWRDVDWQAELAEPLDDER